MRAISVILSHINRMMMITFNNDADEYFYNTGVRYSFRMTEHGHISNEELASAFIASTCELIPKSSSVLSDEMHNSMASRNRKPMD